VKGKFLSFAIALSLPVLLSVALPRSSFGQDTTPAAPAVTEFQRYVAYAGVAYSSANQVKGSSSLYGFTGSFDAKLKPWFGASADFGQYENSTTTVTPTVTTFLAGPSFYVPSEKFDGFFHVLFGGAHTGGVGAIPDISFATAVGGGLEYNMRNHFWVRISGDGIYSSFVIGTTASGDSPHLRINPRAGVGISYHF